jgi:hypothetical protein
LFCLDRHQEVNRRIGRGTLEWGEDFGFPRAFAWGYRWSGGDRCGLPDCGDGGFADGFDQVRVLIQRGGGCEAGFVPEE